ncbi:MAG: DUF5908 family protein [Saprospiraceae bacterium]
MPLEIRELVIKAVIKDNKNAAGNRLDQVDIIALKKEIAHHCLEKMEEKMKIALER